VASDSARESESPAPEDKSNNDAQAVRAASLMDVDDIPDQYDFDNPLFEEYKSVFDKFREHTAEEVAKEDEKPEVFLNEDDEIPDEEDEGEKKLSKRQRKEMNKPTVAQLKSMVKKPELVEWTDISSPDPCLLIEIKGYKNVIPVPNHWSLKREYLSSKRGIEKPPFQLPKFIQETGISEMREAVLEKQAEMTMKQKQRERVQGKLGKMDMDYGKLYDAFFRRQTKPEMTRYGEVYYEGKEFETSLVHLKPGILSDELRDALSLPPGHPPPWLLQQQIHGPPPSYPNLQIPGVNAPIPPGASWGFSPGQWGKPPLEEGTNRPKFGGDPLGQGIVHETTASATHAGAYEERKIWGQLRKEGDSDDEEEEEEEDEDEDEADEEGQDDISGMRTSATAATGMPSEIGGTETIGGEFTLRKQRRGIETEEPGAPRSAYQVLPEKNIQATGFFGGEHAYDLDATRRDTFGDNRKRKAGDIEVSVDVDMLAENDKMDKEALRKQYEAQRKAEMQGQWQSIDQDDLSEMIAAESRKRVKRDDEKRPRR
jgi:splicing factor 3B subunit 2